MFSGRLGGQLRQKADQVEVRLSRNELQLLARWLIGFWENIRHHKDKSASVKPLRPQALCKPSDSPAAREMYGGPHSNIFYGQTGK
ncbi:MAG TPA: hypothetical protein VL020_01305 [Pseudomonadales bacterium]|nr:hypothetical protein [Pseudomonadales bacterium]